MKIRLFFLLLVFVGSCFSLPKKYRVLKRCEGKNSYISYLKDVDGAFFVVKQKRNTSVYAKLCIVRDTLSAYIAEKLKIPTNYVCIISPDVPFPGKQFMREPASLHTYAACFTIRDQTSIYDDLYVQQRWKPKWSYEEKGLTVAVIKNMALHPDLPKIVALDTFIGNSDRHSGNLCYDPDTDTFCGIDMDDTFDKNLCKVACDHIRVILADESIVFIPCQVRGLMLYKTTLEKLIKNFPPHKLQKKLGFFARQVGFAPRSKFYTIGIQHKLRCYKAIMTESYQSAKQLVCMLGNLIAQHTK